MKNLLLSTLALALVTISILLSACTQSVGQRSSHSSNGPSDAQVLALIKAAYQQRIWVEPTLGYEMNGVSNISVDMLRRGEFNEAQKFLPAQVRITGNAQQKPVSVWLVNPKPLQCKFSRTEDFRITKNDYGDLVAMSMASDHFTIREKHMQCGN